MDLLSSVLIAIGVLAAAALIFGWKMFERQKSLHQELKALRRKQEARPPSAVTPVPEPEIHSRSAVRETVASERKHIFLSYSHEDEEVVAELRVHLSPVLRQHNLSLWPDSSIGPHNELHAELSDAIAKSSVAIAVVSPDYLASDLIQNEELPALIAAQRKTDLRLFWLPARPSAVETTDLANCHGLMNPGRPLSTLRPKEREIALVTVAETVARYFERVEGEGAEGTSLHHRKSIVSPIRLVQIRLRKYVASRTSH